MSLPTKTTDSPVGNALNINAGIQLLPASEAATWHTGSWTAALWFKSTTSSSGASDAKIISRDESEYFSIGCVQSANTNNLQNLSINMVTDNGSSTSHYGAIGTVTVNKWHHLAVLYDTFTFQVYLDGEIVFSRASYDPNSTTASRLLAVGANVDSSGILDTGKFIGALTEVKLFNTALAGPKIRGLYESPGSTNPAIVDSTVKFGSSSQVGNNVEISSDGLFMGAPSLAASPFSVTPAGIATINTIKSSVFGNAISLDPDTTGQVVFKGNANRGSGQFVLNCENNSHGVTVKGPPHSAGATYTLTLPNTDGNADELLKTNGSGVLDWVAPYTDSSVDTHLNVSGASSGQILSWNGSDYAWVADQTGGGGSVRTVKVDTDGDGTADNTLESSEELVLKAGTNVTLAEAGGVVTINSSGSSGGISNVVEDTTPQLGGNLDAQDKEIQNVKELGIGFSGSPTYKLQLEDAKGSTTTELIRIKETGSHYGRLINLYKSTNRHGSIGLSTISYGQGVYMASQVGGLKFQNQFTTVVVEPCDGDGGNKDNSIDLGRSNNRFDDIYATNSTIQTSDREEKQDIEELTDAERRVAVAAKGLMRKFRWKNAVSEKGDSARIHFGIIAQDLEAAFTAEGLDPGRYAMFTKTTWWEHEGEPYYEQEHIPEGVTATEVTRRGVRYSELLAFIVAAL